jgi:calcium-dependent protein kinase
LVFDELLHQTPYYNGSSEEEILLKIKNVPYTIRNKDYKDAAFLFEPRKFLIQQILLNTIVRDPTKRKDPGWVIE